MACLESGGQVAHIIALVEGLRGYHEWQVAVHDQSRGPSEVDMVWCVAANCMQGGVVVELRGSQHIRPEWAGILQQGGLDHVVDHTMDPFQYCISFGVVG